MDDRDDPEAAAIETLVKDYFHGMYEGDVKRLERIFNPRCWMFGESRGEGREFPLSGFLGQFASEPAPKSVGEPFDMTLVSVDRTGPVAIAKVAVRYQDRRYTDYLALQKSAAGWQIVSKAFYSPDR